jgi:hypothetical protein
VEWEEVEEGVAKWQEEALDVVVVLVDMVDGGLGGSLANMGPDGERGSAAHGLLGGLVLMVAGTVDGTGGPPGTPCTMTTT